MSSVTVYFAKIKPGAVIPSKRDEDAGYDVYACLDGDFLLLPPQHTLLVPTGIASACPAGYYFQIQERGSIGSRGLAKRCGVIDSGYRGEWFLPLTNTTKLPMYIAKPQAMAELEAQRPGGEFYAFSSERAIAQAILLELPRAAVQELSYEELCAITSKRGAGALGSSRK